MYVVENERYLTDLILKFPLLAKMEKNGTGFPLLSETTKKLYRTHETMIFKTLNLRKQRWWSLSDAKQARWALWLPSVNALAELSSSGAGKVNPVRGWQISWAEEMNLRIQKNQGSQSSQSRLSEKIPKIYRGSNSSNQQSADEPVCVRKLLEVSVRTAPNDYWEHFLIHSSVNCA